jgi:GMP synthase (glutamine-hydrolysing)
MMRDTFAVIDLGGQYCHLIARRLREFGVEADVLPPETPAATLSEYQGIVLSGGPNSVYAQGAPKVSSDLLQAHRPVLGICYGHQLLASLLDGIVSQGESEYGPATLNVADNHGPLFRGLPEEQPVWMSHSDSVDSMPASVRRLASTARCNIAAFGDDERKLYGVQFHPEVNHSRFGSDLLRNFVFEVCDATPRASNLYDTEALIESIRRKVGSGSVFFLVSGGVDSSVAFALCGLALPAERLLGLYVDTGLMRLGETDELRQNLKRLGLSDRIQIRDESERFLKLLAKETDPERKRQIIGKAFVDVQSEAMREFGIDETHWFLGQGTIYPDTIESGGKSGKAALIKTHHNRCAEIQHLLDAGKVVEPLAEFYKDEVRLIGRNIGLSADLVDRWPFPGPGLAIRCLCTETPVAEGESVALPSGFEAMTAFSYPLSSVGVQGDSRTYRAVVAIDGPLDFDALQEISSTLCNTRREFNRVIYRLGHRATSSLSDGRLIPNAKITRQRLDTLRRADAIVRDVLHSENVDASVWQFPVILAPLTFGQAESIILRPVNSENGMTANFARLPHRVLAIMTDRILDEGLADAVFLDATDKPPATIEWE